MYKEVWFDCKAGVRDFSLLLKIHISPHIHLVPRLKWLKLYRHTTIWLHGAQQGRFSIYYKEIQYEYLDYLQLDWDRIHWEPFNNFRCHKSRKFLHLWVNSVWGWQFFFSTGSVVHAEPWHPAASLSLASFLQPLRQISFTSFSMLSNQLFLGFSVALFPLY